MNAFIKATRTQAKLRLALDGPSGSGKTYTALTAAKVLANGGKVAVIDTERGSASLYSDKFDFDVATLDNFNPQHYIDLIKAAEDAGYSVIVIDSLTHAWEGEGGALDLVDDAAKRSQSKNSFTAWKDVTPLHRALVDAMLQSKCHIIATMRSKTEYVIEEVDRNGRKVQMPRKIGLAPIQRQGMEYEFTIVGDLDLDHNLAISKSRMASLADKVETKPGEKFFKQILDWLNSAEKPGETPKAPAFTAPAKVAEPAKVAKPAVDEKLTKAVELKTPRGLAFGNMDDVQLAKVIEVANGEYKQAAEYLTEKASELAWDEYLAIGEKLTKAGVKINDQLPKSATNIQVWRNIRDLRKMLDELNQGVPAEFR